MAVEVDNADKELEELRAVLMPSGALKVFERLVAAKAIFERHQRSAQTCIVGDCALLDELIEATEEAKRYG